MRTLLLVWMLAGFPVLTAAQDPEIKFTHAERTYLKHHPEITYAIDPDYLPFEARDRNGQHIGMSADLLNLLSRRSGIRFRLVPTDTWPETLERIKNREYDFLALAAYTPDRAEYLRFTRPYIEVHAVIATLMHQPYYTDIREIVNKRIGVVRGYAFKQTLEARYPDLRLVEVASVNEGLLKVQSGDLYGIVGNMATLGYRIQQAKMNNIKIAGRIDGDIAFHVAVQIDQPVLAGIMEKLLASVSPQEMQEITNRWWGVRYDHATDYSLVIRTALGLLAAMGLIAVWVLKLRQINRRLADVNERLEALNTQKNYYFSVIGHDLRNPFMAITGFSEALQRDIAVLDRSDISRLAGKVYARSNQVLEMLNQLLEWARLELRQVEPVRVPFDLHLLVREIAGLYESALTDKNLTLNVEVPPGVEVRLDRNMTAAILRNLLSNAVKYSPPGGTVSMVYRPELHRLDIIDQGAGMEAETVAQLFRFSGRRSKPGTRNEHGTGLGLLICQRYAGQMDLNLTVESRPGEGSRFMLGPL